jgi:hypothetical protein
VEWLKVQALSSNPSTTPSKKSVIWSWSFWLPKTKSFLTDLDVALISADSSKREKKPEMSSVNQSQSQQRSGIKM